MTTCGAGSLISFKDTLPAHRLSPPGPFTSHASFYPFLISLCLDADDIESVKVDTVLSAHGASVYVMPTVVNGPRVPGEPWVHRPGPLVIYARFSLAPLPGIFLGSASGWLVVLARVLRSAHRTIRPLFNRPLHGPTIQGRCVSLVLRLECPLPESRGTFCQ